MKVMLALLLLNSKRKIQSGKFAEALKKVGGLLCKLAREITICKIILCRLVNTITTCKIILCRLVNTFPEVGILSSRLAGVFPEVGISSSRLAGAFPEVGITLSRFKNIFPEVGILSSRLAGAFPEVGITLSRFKNIFPEVELAFRRTGRSNLRAEEHENNRTKMENDGNYSFNNDRECNFLTIHKENGIRWLVLRNKDRLSDFYNNFFIHQIFMLWYKFQNSIRVIFAMKSTLIF